MDATVTVLSAQYKGRYGSWDAETLVPRPSLFLSSARAAVDAQWLLAKPLLLYGRAVGSVIIRNNSVGELVLLLQDDGNLAFPFKRNLNTVRSSRTTYFSQCHSGNNCVMPNMKSWLKHQRVHDRAT